ISGSQAIPDQDISSVMVTVDGVPARVRRLVGQTGEIELDVREYANVVTQKMTKLPTPGPDSEVRVTYRYNRNLIKTDLGTRIFYRVTTVAHRSDLDIIQPKDLVETPLERAAATNIHEVEKLDWIWREAVRRNRWILQQGGERVRLFLRKTVGEPCPCCQLH